MYEILCEHGGTLLYKKARTQKKVKKNEGISVPS